MGIVQCPTFCDEVVSDLSNAGLARAPRSSRESADSNVPSRLVGLRTSIRPLGLRGMLRMDWLEPWRLKGGWPPASANRLCRSVLSSLTPSALRLRDECSWHRNKRQNGPSSGLGMT